VTSTLTEAPIAGSAERVPVGLFYSDTFRKSLPHYGENDATTAKREIGFDISRIYQPWSVVASRVLVLVSWLLLFFDFGLCLSLYLRMRSLEIVDFHLQTAGAHVVDDTASRNSLERTVRERIPNLDIAVWGARMAAVECQVCRVDLGDNAIGTGFLVGPAAVLTNYHVVEELIKGNRNARDINVKFDYMILANSALSNRIKVDLHPTDWNLDSSPYAIFDKCADTALPPTSEELDYALLLLARPIGLENYSPADSILPRRRGWLDLPDQIATLDPQAPLVIVQHCDGVPLKMAIDTDAFLGFVGNNMRIRYTTNTKPGSSGSPVFDFSWNLVALHHVGDPAYQGPKFNQGIPINLIRRRIMDAMRPEADKRMTAISSTT
jgi:hypothetical protein